MSLVNNNCNRNLDKIVCNKDNKILSLKNCSENDSISDYYKFLKQNLIKESTLFKINGEYLEKKIFLDTKCEYQYKSFNLKMQEMLIIIKLTKIKQVIKNNNYKIHLIERIKALSKSFDPFIFTTQLLKKYKINEKITERDITMVRALRNLQYQLHKLNNLSI